MHGDILKRAEELFHRALQYSGEERNAFLNCACGQANELRAVVDKLLLADASAGDYLESPLKVSVSMPPNDIGPDPLLEKRIGRFTIVRRIAAGGMGVVYEAEQDEPRRRVALKVMRPGVCSEASVRRFANEATVLARLQHAHIAHVYEAGTWDGPVDSTPYLAVEYLADARTITDFARERGLSTHARIELFIKVCGAVEHGHQRGIIHRDLKPGNILVLPSGEPKVIDFGIARMTDENITVTTHQLESSNLIGTLRYMSPEQFAGDAADIDTRSDVYALGVVLFEVLTGQPPYDLATASPFDIPRIIRDVEAVRMADFNPALKGDIETVTQKALEKDRERRYQSVGELARDLLNVLYGNPIEARRDSKWYVLRKMVGRHMLAVASASSAIVLLVTSAVVMAMLYREAAAQKVRAEQALLKSVAAEKAARQTTSFLADLFKASDPFTGDADAMTSAQLLEKGVERLRGELADEPGPRATLLTTIGNILVQLGRYDQATPLLQEAYQLRGDLYGPAHPETAHSQSALGSLYMNQGELESAERALRAALATQRRSFNEDHEQVADTLEALGILMFYKKDYRSAEPLLRENLEMRQRLFGERHRSVPIALGNLALALDGLGQEEESERLLRKALTLNQTLFGASHASVATTMSNLSGVLYNQGKISEAIELGEEALVIHRRILGDAHPAMAAGLNNLGAFYNRQGDSVNAEKCYHEALEVSRRAFGDQDFRVALVLENIGALLLESNRTEDAEPYYAEALKIHLATLGRDHVDTVECYLQLGRIKRASADSEAAESYFRSAYESRLRTLGPDHPKTLSARQLLENGTTQRPLDGGHAGNDDSK